jgi:GT2 family glycosyltransferase
MPEVSILLPSLREQQVLRRLEEFSETNRELDYEIIVVSPFSVEGDKIVHLQETEQNGVLSAMNNAYAIAKSEFIVLWSDDAIPRENCIQNILEYARQKQGLYAVGFAKEDEKGAGFGQWQVYDKLYVGWLCTSKSTVDSVGGLFDPIFTNYWGDPDLCMRIWENGGSVDVCNTALIQVAQSDDEVKSQNLAKSFSKDTERFLDRWHPKYGKWRRRVWWLINCEVPITANDHIRAALRHIPFLKLLIDTLQKGR